MQPEEQPEPELELPVPVSAPPDISEQADEYGSAPWSGTLAVEGVWSGDGRQFAPNALEWAELPLPLKWQPAEAPGHEGAVTVGRIDAITRKPDGQICGTGVMDGDGPAGVEAMRQMRAGMLRGVSVMADDTEADDVEMIMPEGMDGPDMMMPAGKMLIHHGRIRSATLVAEPAFAEASIKLGEPAVMVAAAVAPHDTATSDGPWDGPAAEKALPSPMPEATARAAYAWIEDGAGPDVRKDQARFIHHEVSADGTPGAANIKACQSGIGILNGGRGGTTIPAADMQGVYNHLAGHIRDAGLEPPEATFNVEPAAVTAAAYTVTIPEVWPESWFDEPTDAPPFGALHITPQGRVYGYLGPAHVTHRAFRGTSRTVTIPRGVDYSEFQNKPCLVAGADGNVYRINAGNVTFDCGHASPFDQRRADEAWAMQHYDNSCSIAARVRVGENEHGTWVAGGLLHGITPDAMERMMACALSGDWQGGKLKGALLVPVEGFPVPVTASVRVRDDALVASTVPIRFEHPNPAPEPEDVTDLFDLVASAIGHDDDSRWSRLLADVGR